MFGIGPSELIVILLIALIVFGPKRLPEIGRTLGKSLREFRQTSSEIREEFTFDLDEDLEPPPAAPSPAPPQSSEVAEQGPQPGVQAGQPGPAASNPDGDR